MRWKYLLWNVHTPEMLSISKVAVADNNNNNNNNMPVLCYSHKQDPLLQERERVWWAAYTTCNIVWCGMITLQYHVTRHINVVNAWSTLISARNSAVITLVWSLVKAFMWQLHWPKNWLHEVLLTMHAHATADSDKLCCDLWVVCHDINQQCIARSGSPPRW